MTVVGIWNGDQPLHDLFGPEAVSDDTHAVNQRLAAKLAAVVPPVDRAAMRDAYSRGELSLPVSPKSPNARSIVIPGPGGEIGLRILVPDSVRGVFLHLHGGGWTAGTNDMWDNYLELIGREAGLVAVSVDYRLAPEHVFPAAVDDCVAAAHWLIANAEKEFGVTWLAIGGESAGAHLAVSTLLRLRDAGQAGAFQAASIMYGAFDLSLTPSMRQGERAMIIDRGRVEALASGFAGKVDLRDPALSPLYADLTDLPPALVSIGTLDPLLDDSLFIHMRWQAAGNESQLAVYPGGVHAFNFLDGVLARDANEHAATFLRTVRERF